MHDYNLQSELLIDLQTRGFIYQSTNLAALDSLASKEKIIAYVGFDCTAQSFHVGNLMQIMLMRRLQQHGHTPIILLGSATTKIGDPSDKQGLRKVLSAEEIQHNKMSLQKVFQKFLNFSPDISNPAKIVDNLDWLADVKYLDFLRDYGSHFSINRMLTFDSIKMRLDRQTPLTFLEFNYMLLQAYDFIELYKTYSCKLQFGGSEQWANIVSGIELGRRVMNTDLFGITTPLITTSGGTKMGKTASGAVWLNEEMLSPYNYWQFWHNTADSDVIKFMKLYTDISIKDINKLQEITGQELNEVKKMLADEVTKLCHGADHAIIARKNAEDAFEKNLNISIENYNLNEDMQLYKVVYNVGFAVSNSEARTLIQARAVRINDQIALDDKMIITIKNLPLTLKVGKKKVIQLIYNQ